MATKNNYIQLICIAIVKLLAIISPIWLYAMFWGNMNWPVRWRWFVSVIWMFAMLYIVEVAFISDNK